MRAAVLHLAALRLASYTTLHNGVRMPSIGLGMCARPGFALCRGTDGSRPAR